MVVRQILGAAVTKYFGKNGMEGTVGKTVLTTIGIGRRLAQVFAHRCH